VAILLNFLNLQIQFTANLGPAQRIGLHYHILVFYAESDSFNDSYQWRSPLGHTDFTYRHQTSEFNNHMIEVCEMGCCRGFSIKDANIKNGTVRLKDDKA